MRVFHEHLRELRADQRRLVREKRERYQNMVEEVISDGAASGEFRELDPRLTTLALFGMVDWAYQSFSPAGPLRAARSPTSSGTSCSMGSPRPHRSHDRGNDGQEEGLQ